MAPRAGVPSFPLEVPWEDGPAEQGPESPLRPRVASGPVSVPLSVLALALGGEKTG